MLFSPTNFCRRELLPFYFKSPFGWKNYVSENLETYELALFAALQLDSVFEQTMEEPFWLRGTTPELN